MATAQGGGLPLPASPAVRSFPPPPGALGPGFLSLQRQHCYLCDLPRTPWALLLSDYSEPVCRGCVNYEGPHRVETAIDSARRLKQSLGAAVVVPDCTRPTSRLPGHLISLPVPVSARDDGLRVLSARCPGDGVRLVGAGGRAAASTVDLGVVGARGPVPPSGGLPRRVSDDARPPIPSSVGAGLPSHPRFPPPIPGLDAVGLGAASLPLALVRSGLGDLPAVINGKRPTDPTRALLSPPSRLSDDVRRQETVSPSTAARSKMVIETLATLACSAPFDVRLRMDHSVIGRVLAFDAAKPGAVTGGSPLGTEAEPLQLAMFVELPTGSGLVYGCCGEASPVGWQIADGGDPTPFRHLEYRAKQDADDWRPLCELLSEPVRCFRDPIDRTRLPQAGRPSLSLVDAAAKAGAAALGYGWNAAAAAAVALHLPPFMRPFQLPNPLLPAAGSRKRKATGSGDGAETPAELSASSTLPGRLDLAADGLAIKRRLWMQSQADALRLALSFPVAAAAAARTTDGAAPVERPEVGGAVRPPPRRSNSSSPPSARSRHQQRTTSSGDETAVNHRHSGSRSPSAHSPAPDLTQTRPSSTNGNTPGSSQPPSPTRPRSVRPGGPDLTPTRPSSTNGDLVGSGQKRNGSPSPRCTLCRGRLEDTHFVQCPSAPEHRFCFPCSRDSIKQQLGAVSSGHPAPVEVYCPSGERCPLLPGVPGGVPWAFMASEIETIIGSGGTAELAPEDQPASSTATTTTAAATTTTSSNSTTTSSSGKDVKIKKERDS